MSTLIQLLEILYPDEIPRDHYPVIMQLINNIQDARDLHRLEMPSKKEPPLAAPKNDLLTAVNWETAVAIQQLHKQGKTGIAIAKKLGIDRRTVYSHLNNSRNVTGKKKLQLK